LSSTRRDFFGAFTGRLSAVPRARPRQRSRTGQRRHFELHEGLVENPRVRLGFRENILDLGADGFFRLGEGNVAAVIRQAGDNPEDVAVHRRFPPGKGRGGDGGGSVVPHAGEGQELFIGFGEASPVRH